MSSIITKIDPPIDTFFERPNPTDMDLNDPEFQRVWQAIKGWDIQRNAHEGYAYADGSDVMTILNAIRDITPATQSASPPVAFVLPSAGPS